MFDTPLPPSWLAIAKTLGCGPIQPALLAAIFVIFFVAHGLADYWVQTDWQAANKSRNAHALWSHIASYALVFAFALALVRFWFPAIAYAKIVVALPLIALPHAWIDTRKLITWFCERTKGWRRDNLVPYPVTRERIAAETGLGLSVDDCFIVPDGRHMPPLLAFSNQMQLCYVESECMLYRNGLNSWISRQRIEPFRPLNAWEVAIRLHVTIALDQQLHYLCLALVAAWLAC